VTLALRGSRKFNQQEERIENEAELRRVRWQARRVIIKGFLVALPITLLAYLLPW
jgi:hypothetical protein